MTAVTRHFLTVGKRLVHYRRAGSGPPVVLVHASPTSSEYLLPLINHLAQWFTCFAFDTPSFGDSEALKPKNLTMREIAAAFDDTLRAIGMPRCPVFGTHTGGGIVTELARRYPERVSGLIIDGLSIFTPEEQAEILDGYFVKIRPDDLGGQFAPTWTRSRDQIIWFPWHRKTAENLRPNDLGSPADIHRWALSLFRAGNSYSAVYTAAFRYSDETPDALRELQMPATFMATARDMLFPHLDRLPPLKPDQAVVRLDNDQTRYLAAVTDAIRRYSEHDAPPNDPLPASGSRRQIRFFTGPAGGQIAVRRIRRRGRPLMLLHDVPGSSRQVATKMKEIGRTRTVLTLDLPGCGESDPLPMDTPSVADYADCVARVIRSLDLGSFDLHAQGFSGALAIELAGRDLGIASLTLHNFSPGPSPQIAPPIEFSADGGHWYRTWMMLRDAQIYLPWYEPTHAHLRQKMGCFDPQYLHDLTVEVMKQPRTYGQLAAASLGYPTEAALKTLTIPVEIVTS